MAAGISAAVPAGRRANPATGDQFTDDFAKAVGQFGIG